MCPDPSPKAADLADDSAEEYTMPSAEAMLAGTLALMTGYAQHADAGTRSLMARKVVSNLFFLSGHPHLSDAFRAMVGNLRTRWQLEVAQGGHCAQPDLTPTAPQNLWHTTPAAVQ